MKIGIGTLQGVIGGPRTYAYNLIKGLLEIDKENEYFIFSDNINGLNEFTNAEKVKIPLVSPYARPLWDNINLPRNLRKYKIDIYHDTKNDTPVWCPCKCITTIHDLAVILFPETFNFLQRAYIRFQMKWTRRNAQRIITISESSKNDLINHLGIDRDIITAIPLASNAQFRKIEDKEQLSALALRKKYNLAEKIILFVGTIQPRKNIDILVKAFSNLEKTNKIPHQLIIVGRKGWLYKHLEKEIAELNLGEDVRFLGSVEDSEIPLFYNIAEIFVSPSSYEGFGLTILEAMACGVPVITSNCSSIPEVVGDAGILIDRVNVENLSKAILDLISNQNIRESLIEKGLKRAKEFSWRKTAEQTLKVYQSVYNF